VQRAVGVALLALAAWMAGRATGEIGVALACAPVVVLVWIATLGAHAAQRMPTLLLVVMAVVVVAAFAGVDERRAPPRYEGGHVDMSTRAAWTTHTTAVSKGIPHVTTGAQGVALVRNDAGAPKLLLVCHDDDDAACAQAWATWDGWARSDPEHEPLWRAQLLDHAHALALTTLGVPMAHVEEDPASRRLRVRLGTLALVVGTMALLAWAGGSAPNDGARRRMRPDLAR
jgi:hypothetical protein